MNDNQDKIVNLARYMQIKDIIMRTKKILRDVTERDSLQVYSEEKKRLEDYYLNLKEYSSILENVQKFEKMNNINLNKYLDSYQNIIDSINKRKINVFQTEFYLDYDKEKLIHFINLI